MGLLQSLYRINSHLLTVNSPVVYLDANELRHRYVVEELLNRDGLERNHRSPALSSVWVVGEPRVEVEDHLALEGMFVVYALLQPVPAGQSRDLEEFSLRL